MWHRQELPLLTVVVLGATSMLRYHEKIRSLSEVLQTIPHSTASSSQLSSVQAQCDRVSKGSSICTLNVSMSQVLSQSWASDVTSKVYDDTVHIHMTVYQDSVIQHAPLDEHIRHHYPHCKTSLCGRSHWHSWLILQSPGNHAYLVPTLDSE